MVVEWFFDGFVWGVGGKGGEENSEISRVGGNGKGVCSGAECESGEDGDRGIYDRIWNLSKVEMDYILNDRDGLK